jgi:transglutaminase-like putative cysteine protease
VRYQIEHRIKLSFSQAVSEQHCELRLFPRESDYQSVESFELVCKPQVSLFDYVDSFDNRVHHFSIVPPHQELEICCRTVVNNQLENPFHFLSPLPAEEQAQLAQLLKQEPRFFDYVSSRSDQVPSLTQFKTKWVLPKYDPNKNLLESVQDAMSWICRHLTYLPGSTEVHNPLEEVLEKRSGVCQDFAHLLIAIVRDWGWPARYVMGYQYLKEEEKKTIPATHAWVEIYIPVAGWCGFDVTHQLLTNDTYIPVAVGRDSYDAAPQRGSYKGPQVGQEPKVFLKVNIPQ